MLARKALAGTAGAPKVYVEDVFSTYLYTGTGATNTISNNIDLSGEGGLVWIKDKGNTTSNALIDTARGINKYISSNRTGAQDEFGAKTDILTAFNNNGFTLGADATIAWTNFSSRNYTSWTFRKAEKFFDVVTYTGNGGTLSVSHSLASKPGCIIIKRTDNTGDWLVCTRKSDGNIYAMYLNTTAGQFYDGTEGSLWTSTAVSINWINSNVASGYNDSGATYVMYVLAHNAGGFGDAGSDSIIKCGSFTTDANGEATVTLDWEPQWVLLKGALTSYTTNWNILDSMRGMPVSGNQNQLRPNTADTEISTANASAFPNATGFKAYAVGGATLSGHTYIYIAIRRGPMKTPTTGTSVFEPVAYSGTSANDRIITASITPDLVTWANRDSTGDRYEYDRLRGSGTWLKPNTTGAEGADGTTYGVQFNKVQTGYQQGTADGGFLNSSSNYVNWLFRRAPGFFDVVCYTGTGSARTVSHNLSVVPELMIVKNRSNALDWAVYDSTNGNTKAMFLNKTDASSTLDYWNNTSPTSSVFTVNNNNRVNASGNTYVAYLFASLSGVSSIGTYTGNGSSVTVTTNFQPRFIMVKRTDSTGDWIVSDSARGLVAGNDPFLKLNSTAAEVTNEDWVDISSTSFTVNQTTNNANVNTGTYIYLAIA